MKKLLVSVGAVCGALGFARATTVVLEAESDRTATVEEIAQVEALGADDTVQKTGGGKLTYTGALAFAGTLQIDAGTFAVAYDGKVTNRMTLKGAGTFRQESGERVVDATADTTPDSPDFTGDYVIAGGYNTLRAKKASIALKYGKLEANLIIDGGTLRTLAPSGVGTGTTDDFSSMTFSRKPVHVKGAGADGTGAILSDYYYNGILKQMILDGDALVGVWVGERGYTSQYICFSKDGNAAKTIDLQGYQLTVSNVPSFVINQDAVVSGAGRVVLKNTTTAGKNFSQYKNVSVDPGTTLTFSGGTFGMYIYSQASDLFAWPVEIDLPSDKYVQFYNVYTAVTNTLTQPIMFKESNLGYVQFAVSRGISGISLDGALSGPGRIVMAKGSNAANHLNQLSVNGDGSDFTGSIEMEDGQYGQRLVLDRPDAVADLSKIKAKNGAVVVNGANWSSADIKNLRTNGDIATATAYRANGVFVNTDACTDKTATFSVTDDDFADGMAPIGHDGPGTLVLSANAPTNPVQLRTGGGTIELTGEHIVLSNAVWSQTADTADVAVRIADASDVRVMGKVPAQRSTVFPVTEDPLVIALTNATVKDVGGTLQEAPIILGYDQPTVLVVEPDTVLESAMNVGYVRGAGAVYQRGGDVYIRDTDTWGTRAWIGYSTDSCGYYELAAGTLTNNYIMTLGGGGAKTCGIIRQTGGRFDAYQVNLGNTAAVGQYEMAGGEANISSVINFGRADSGNVNCDSILVQEGGELTTKSTVLCCASSNNLSILTLAGGRFSSPGRFSKGVVASGNKGVYRRPEWNRAYLNFNGGTYHYTGKWELFSTNDLVAIDRITVFEKGATVEIDSGNAVYHNLPFQAPTGRGIASVPWTGEFTEHKFVGPPSVRILGDGCGATAIARFDSATRTVTGIDVIAPGSGYSWAKVELAYGRNGSTSSPVLVQTNECVLTETTPASGDFIKAGGGTLQMQVPNTYGGDTVVQEGTLELCRADALPTGSRLVLKGGIVTAAEGIDLPPVTVSLAVGTTQDYAAAPRFAEGSSVIVSGAADEAVSEYVLATYPSWSGELPVWTNAADYPNWKLRFGAKKCRLVQTKGMAVIIR